MFIPKKRGKRVYRKRTTKRTKPITKVAKVVKSYVKKEIARQAENKVINIQQAREFGSYLDSNTMNVFPMTPYPTLFPAPTLGTASNNRIGNQIRTRKVMLNYVLRPTVYSVANNPNPVPVHVQMYLGYVKQSSGVIPTSSEFNFFYNNGSSSFAPSATLADLISQENKDRFTILKKWTHRVAFANYAGSGGQLAWQTNANNDFKSSIVKKLDITKMYPKILKFDDANQAVQGRGLFLFYQAISANGNALAAGIRPVAIEFWVHLEFEDA